MGGDYKFEQRNIDGIMKNIDITKDSGIVKAGSMND